MVVVRYPRLPTHMTEPVYVNPDQVNGMDPGPYSEPLLPPKKEDDNMCVLCMNFTGNILYDTICNPFTWISYCFLDSLDGQFCNNWCWQ